MKGRIVRRPRTYPERDPNECSCGPVTPNLHSGPSGDSLHSPGKLWPPAPAIDIFNCELEHGKASVTDERIYTFLADNPSQAAEDAFAAYCASVEMGNEP